MPINKELYINDELVDLGDDTVIAQTLQVHDLKSLETRNTNFSNSIKLPKTSRNLDIFRIPQEVQSQTIIPYQRNTARYFQDGVPIIPDGFAIVTNVNSYINIAIYSGNAFFFDEIPGHIYSLDFSTYNHIWNRTAAVDNRDNDNTDGYTYPLIDYGNMVDTHLVDAEELFPAMFVKTIWDKIISEAGYTYSGDLLTDDRFLGLVNAWSNDEWENSQDFIDEITSGATIADTMDFLDGGSATYQGTGHAVSTQYHYDLETFLLARSSTTPLPGGRDLYAKIRNKTTATDITSLQKFTYNASSSTYTLTINEANVLIADGDELQIEYSIITPIADPEPDIAVTVDSSASYLTWTASKDIQLNDTINMQDQLPDMTRVDFIKAIMNVLGLFFIIDEDRKHINVYNYQKIKDNESIAVDWSDKYVDQEDGVMFKFGNYGQTSYFKWTEDERNNNTDEGEGFIEVPDSTLDLEADIINLPFAGSSMVSKTNVPLEVSLIDKSDEDNELTEKTEPRLLVRRLSTGSLTYQDDDGNTAITDDLPNYYFTGGDEDLDYNTLIDDYYNPIETMLNKSKILKIKLRLTALDINNFDQSVPVYIDRFSAYFYVNKIFNYKPNQLTDVELIRI